MKKNKFSIIVPVYNVSEYINRCVDSIILQKYDSYEIIIVNDGSTDDSLLKLEKYNGKNIKILTKTNGGLSSARNYGLKYASGEYVWFVDGDDYIEADSLKRLNEKINLFSDKPDILVFQHNEVYKDKKIRIVDRISWDNNEYLPLVSVSACTKIYKMSFIKKYNVRFAEGLIYEDLEINPFLLCKANYVEFIKEPLYNYVVQREGSIMNQKVFNNNRDDKFIVLERLIRKFKDDDLYSKYHEQLTYLSIRHLIMILSREIMIYNKDIYVPRCNRVINFLNDIDKMWYKNKYLKESSISSRLFAFFYRKKLFLICKIMVIIYKRK